MKEAVEIREETDIKRDAVIQRFEFTFELLWKTLKRIARLEKIECFSPKTAFRAAFQLGLIDDEQMFIEIIDARNMTSHVYSEKQAEAIYDFIKEKAITAFARVEERIGGYI